MTKKEFDAVYLGKAVHCDTEEKALEFLALADSFSYRWKRGNSLIEKSYWDVYEEKTHYFVEEPRRLSDYACITFDYPTKFPENYCKYPAHKTESQVSVISETISTERYQELLEIESKWNNLMKVIKGEK